MHRLPAAASDPRLQRWAAALAASVAVHGLLLAPAGPRPSPPPAAAPSAAPALQTRAIAAPASPPAVASDTAPLARPAPRPRTLAPAVTGESPPAAIAAPATADTTAGPLGPLARIAPPVEWIYALQQDGKTGLARLSWQPQDGGYVLELQRELAGRNLPGWRSQGRLQAAGLAPERYAQRRPGRQGWQDQQATNFRHDEGLISYSASAERVPLPAGVQDRISWWLQLAARIAAAPQLHGLGSEIRLPVAGLRGEVSEWVFEVLGPEPLALPNSVVGSALRLRRASLGPYDGAIEVWLDPARAHLPVQVRVGSPEAPEGRGWQLQLIDDSLKP